MPRLYRPHIPVIVHVQVAVRQLGPNIFALHLHREDGESLDRFLERILPWLATQLSCERNALHLDHDPALATRMKRSHFNGKRWITFYSPDANDPAYLIYREKHAHHIKTNIRGDHGQHPDRVLIKKERKRLRGKTGRTATKSHFHFSTDKSKPKMKSRPLQSANRWPAKGSRKIENRRKR